MRSAVVFTIILFLPVIGFAQTTWYVPDDFPAGIQAAIQDSSVVNGDTIIVRPGTYFENIDFLGKAITVQSEQGAAVTSIDGNQAGSVITFKSGEGVDSILDGFTVTNGLRNRGGGISCRNSSSPTITNNTITENSADNGGGIDCRANSSPTITNNTFTGNTAIFGGGIYCSGNSSPPITNNTISGNSASNGGGVYCYNNSSPPITNSTITANTASGGGGGIYSYSSDPTLTNNTITVNTAGSGGGIYCRDGSTLYHPTITNTILWDNSAPAGPEIFVASGSGRPIVTYCDVKGGVPGTGNIDADPLCVDPGNDDYHLTSSSPCRNAGDNAASDLPIEDFEGHTRIAEGVVDIGADEYWIVDNPFLLLDVKCNGEDADVIVLEVDNALLTISIQSWDNPGRRVDVWVIARDGVGDKKSCSNGRWWHGWSKAYYTSGLYDVFDTIHDNPLPVGSYNVWLGLDHKANGNLNADKVFIYDVVDFTVVP